MINHITRKKVIYTDKSPQEVIGLLIDNTKPQQEFRNIEKIFVE